MCTRPQHDLLHTSHTRSRSLVFFIYAHSFFLPFSVTAPSISLIESASPYTYIYISNRLLSIICRGSNEAERRRAPAIYPARSCANKNVVTSNPSSKNRDVVFFCLVCVARCLPPRRRWWWKIVPVFSWGWWWNAVNRQLTATLRGLFKRTGR